MRVINLTRNKELAHTVIMADSFLARFKGLMGRPGLAPGWCLVLKPCRAVHTMFMRFAIDILFVDRKGMVVRTVAGLPPFRLSGAVRDAHLVIEFSAGTLAPSGTSAGDKIIITK